MKEWIKKFLILVLLFGIVYIIIFNFINIDEGVSIPKDANILTKANKKLAVGALSIIGTSVIFEIYTIIRFINKTISPETFKMNLIKLVIITLSLFILCTLAYYIYLVNSATRIVYT